MNGVNGEFTNSRLSHFPQANSFGDALLCPVCFIMFEGRIHQCSQGHSVCEKCYRQLGTAAAQCPQCRSTFVGTRNYILEDLVKQLKIIKQSCANATTSDAENGNSEAKINKAMEQIFNSIPIANDNESAEAPVPSSVGAPTGVSFSLPAVPTISTPPPNHQPPGLFNCRMLSCDHRLPSCRLLNHIRSFHAADLMEVISFQFNINQTIQKTLKIALCRTLRNALHHHFIQCFIHGPLRCHGADIHCEILNLNTLTLLFRLICQQMRSSSPICPSQLAPIDGLFKSRNSVCSSSS